MTTGEQLALVDVPAAPAPGRQTTVYEAVLKAGREGLDAADAGRLIRPERLGDNPRFDADNGRDVLHALKKKRLVRLRRATRLHPGGWVVADAQVEVKVQPAGMLPADQPLPY